MLPLDNRNLKVIQNILEWTMAGIFLPIGLFSMIDDWLTRLSYIPLAVVLCPLTSGARWLKFTIALIALLIV